MMSRILRFLMLLCLAPLWVSCTGLPRGWKEARDRPSQNGPSGAWQGTWKSGVNGHQGKLRCAVFPRGPGRWEYRYRATWAKVLCAGFTVECEGARQEDGSWIVEGERDLGRLFGGVFSHTGTVKGDQLRAEYRAAIDRGLLELQRVPPEKLK